MFKKIFGSNPQKIIPETSDNSNKNKSENNNTKPGEITANDPEKKEETPENDNNKLTDQRVNNNIESEENKANEKNEKNKELKDNDIDPETTKIAITPASKPVLSYIAFYKQTPDSNWVLYPRAFLNEEQATKKLDIESDPNEIHIIKVNLP